VTVRAIRLAVSSILVLFTFTLAGSGQTALVPMSAQRIADETSRRESVAYFRAGQELMSAEQFGRAADEFARAIEKNPLFSIAHYQLGQANMNMQRFASAIAAYKSCIEAERQLFTLKQTDRFAVEKERDDEIKELRNILSTGKGREITKTQLEQRLRDLENQRSQTGGSFQAPAQVLLALGSAYFRNGDREGAEAQWRGALDANPKLGEAHNNLAVIYMQAGRFDEASAELSLAEKAGFKVNPQFKADLKERAKTKK
jgi:tetratricopeptide (TPR) repeat protein